jgi:hypothetical protein
MNVFLFKHNMHEQASTNVTKKRYGIVTYDHWNMHTVYTSRFTFEKPVKVHFGWSFFKC